ncbi:hypothetical protein [Brevibacillus porteri]|uniref:Uncharacterized protein n=1 Tax=Brevibacillus porteri TaxID=2126350 RepID=A0ABX5FGY8_9BACL|nr:hypothetical protein [Brevibacillus porteri]MED1800315.1 hypothetical protein [Brevibacillus porteri]MED2130823.1 hypothetical protein [Brevibacillus porteri]MED2744917.1 hypothetical protein [Brevibacillus porteri]MED2813367.1 hypothetical protein [Brevibacillus porteri]MED2894963.1 hypothetical protein [Brevibacillus porteri]
MNNNEIDKEVLLLQHEAEKLQQVMESRAQYRKVVQAAIAQWIKELKAGEIKISTVDDFRKLVELDLELLKGE